MKICEIKMSDEEVAQYYKDFQELFAIRRKIFYSNLSVKKATPWYNIEDILQEAFISFCQSFDKTRSNPETFMINTINLYVKHFFRRQIKKSAIGRHESSYLPIDDFVFSVDKLMEIQISKLEDFRPIIKEHCSKRAYVLYDWLVENFDSIFDESELLSEKGKINKTAKKVFNRRFFEFLNMSNNHKNYEWQVRSPILELRKIIKF